MPIQYPITAHKDEGSIFSYLRDASGRVIAGGLIGADAAEIVGRLNVVPKRKSKREQVVEDLRRSDLTAQYAERDDIEYGPHDSLPRGEHVARMKG